MAEPTVYVVDDDALVRSTVRRLIRTIGVPVKTFGSCGEFLAHFDPDAPGCLVLEVRPPVMAGLELLQSLAHRGSRMPSVIITAYGDVRVAVEAVRAGAIVVIERPYPPQELLEGVQRALGLEREVRRQGRAQGDIRHRVEALSPVEREVLGLLVDGLSSRAVADRLGVSPEMGLAHRDAVLDKMNAGSEAQLVRLLITAGSEST